MGELGSIAARDASPAARLGDMVRAYAGAVMTHHDAVGLYLREWRSLPPAEIAALGARRRRMRALFIDVIDDGVRAGSFAAGDAKIVALAILGSCNWLYEWYRPKGRLSPAMIAEELAVRSVRA